MPDDSSAKPAVRAAFLYDQEGEAAIARYSLKHETVLATIVRQEKRFRVFQTAPTSLLVFAGMMYATSRAQLGEVSWVLAGIVTACYMVLASLWAASSGTWTQFMGKLREAGRHRGRVGERAECEATARGVKLIYADAATEYGWKYIDRVVRAEGFIAFLFAGAANGIPVPVAAFASEAEALAFEEAARALLDASGYDNRTRVRTALSSRSVRCDRCSYQLHKVADTKCPECGRPLNVLTLRCLEYLQEPLWRRLLMPRRAQRELARREWG